VVEVSDFEGMRLSFTSRFIAPPVELRFNVNFPLQKTTVKPLKLAMGFGFRQESFCVAKNKAKNKSK
jgi:hypothetical protein